MCTAIGLGVGCVLLFLAFFLTFTICMDTTYAKLLFSFAVLADPSLMNRWWLALFVALVQYPVYFGLIALVRARKRSLLGVCIMGLIVMHIAGMFGAAAREKTLHERLWREAQQQ
jgi:hypothetical protein